MIELRVTRQSAYFLIFTLSGFSGLIYESIWTHYLKLFLGHAAYAQTLVLAIFMGGMAVGSWLCSRYSGRWQNPLLWYAAAEAIIGVCALAFHLLFTRAVDLSYSVIIPQLASPLAVDVFKWSLAAALILPQCILLGMTFPLMSAGLLRLFPDSPGRSLALLYFTNSIGAAIGVLASGFFLIRLVGLPWTVGIAGIINLALAVTVWSICKVAPVAERSFAPPATAVPLKNGAMRYRLFLVVSLVTGVASFIYEIGWIRMLSLVLGTSTHAFELMLSAFILGLACGGLWIQRRIDRLAAPLSYLARVQVVMGLLALATLPLYGVTFAVMRWLVTSLAKSDTGYLLFNLASSAIAMAIMLPATFCAGMTLPLITFCLIRAGNGERSIGAVYGANTVGAIIGVFFAVHVGMPLLGLKGLITCGAGLDIALGLALFWGAALRGGHYQVTPFISSPSPSTGGRGPGGGGSRIMPISWQPPPHPDPPPPGGRGLIMRAAAVTALGVGAVAATLGFVNLDLVKMGSGVYRHGILLNSEHFRHLYHLDGKTATVDVFRDGLGSTRINTNGKTDATIMMDPERSAGLDEHTMVLLAAIPMALHPHATTAAAIGLGSGLTTHTLLCNPRLARVDTVEIEQGMVEAARNFRPNVELVYTDPRSLIHVDDAKTFFSSRNGRYDLIISEPSNPWVSGVAGLFSDEFYRLIKRSLRNDGLFVQWVQLYEINLELVVSVLKAVATNFADFVVYAPDDRDILIVAKKSGQVPEPDPDFLKNPVLASALRRVQIGGAQDIAVRKIGSKKMLGRLLASFPVRANSDYYPVLDQNAARTRFLNESAGELLNFSQEHLPTLERLAGSPLGRRKTEVTPTAAFPKSQDAFTAMAIRDYILSGSFDPRYADVAEEDKKLAIRLRKMFHECNAVTGQGDGLESLFVMGMNITPYLAPAELEAIWQALEAGPCAAALPVTERRLVALFEAAGRGDGSGMTDSALALLGAGNVSPAALKYLTASAMLGYLLNGNNEESYRLWSKYRYALFEGREPDLLFRLLAAESASP
jgi:spermidine synthase